MPPKKRGRENGTLSGRTVKQQKVLNIIDQKFMKVKDQTFQKFLINELRSKGQEKLAMLYKLMGAPETYKGIKRARRESGLTVDQIIERQVASMDKHTIKYDRKGRIFDLKSDDIIDFALMMYLDMYHDETVTTDFRGFLKSRIPTTFLKRKEIPFQETNFLKKMKDSGIIGDNLIPIKGFETEFKNNLSSIFDLTDIKSLPARKTGFMKRRIYVCIDQEGKQGHLSALVDRGKIPGINPPRYLILPLLTPANFIDAGGGMVGAGVRAEAERMFDHTRDFRLRGKFVPNIDTFFFGRSIIKIIPGDKYKILLNGKEINAGLSKDKAKKSDATIYDKISKFLGDFLQILSVELIKELKIPVVTASGDGMMSAMSMFIQQRVLNRGKNTKFILDKSLMGSADIIEYYGLSGALKSGQGNIIKFKSGQNTNNEFSPVGSIHSSTPTRTPTPRGARPGARDGVLRSRLATTAAKLELDKKNKEIKRRNALYKQLKQEKINRSAQKNKELARRKALYKQLREEKIAKNKQNERAAAVKRKRGNNAATKPESITRTASAPKSVKVSAVAKKSVVKKSAVKKSAVKKSAVSATPKKAKSKSPNTVLMNTNSSASSNRN